MSRALEAKPADVCRAFADPAALVRFWGRDGDRHEVRVFEFRPGGAWHGTVDESDGTRRSYEATFVEIREPTGIVLRLVSRPPHFVEVDVAPAGGGSRVTVRQVFASADERERHAADADRYRPDLARLARVLSPS